LVDKSEALEIFPTWLVLRIYENASGVLEFSAQTSDQNDPEHGDVADHTLSVRLGKPSPPYDVAPCT